MSISNQVEKVPNPAKKFLEFKKNGEWQFYDKETKQNVVFSAPFEFVVLDELSTITGWNDASQSGIYSNEIHSTQNQPLTVKSWKGGEIACGLYADIKDKIKASGGRYTKSVYVLCNDEIINLKMHGASLSPWIDKEFKVSDSVVKFETTVEGKKGSNTYKIPVFTAVPITEESKAEAVAADRIILQPYFADYFEATRKYRERDNAEIATAQVEKEEVAEEKINVTDLPF